MEKKIGPWRTLRSREVHRTQWLRVREDDVIRPDGKPGTYSVIECRPAVGVVALDDDERIYLVGQHRYPVDSYSWEIPAGGVDGDEESVDAAKRELREEAGLVAKQWTPLGWTHALNGVSDAMCHFYMARDLEAGMAAPDDTEDLQVKLMPLEEAFRMCQSGDISDAYTVVAVFRAWNLLRRS